MMKRCSWCGKDPLYIAYHDEEWGVPVHDDRKQFEFLVLESAQAGLSWLTVLRKRENYRKAYDNFEPKKIARYGEKKVVELLENNGIIRNRRKIESSINNAHRFIEIQREFRTFDHYLWRFVDFQPVVGRRNAVEEIPAKTALSDEISADLKKRGFTFLGSIIIYAHLQAVGVVNDHIMDCFRFTQITQMY
jgi:DNA-3-methyladenine glycosylase I